MIGDTLDDVEAGHRAGARSVLLDSGGETEWRLSPLREPDGRFNAWEPLVDQLLAAVSPLPSPDPLRAASPAQMLDEPDRTTGVGSALSVRLRPSLFASSIPSAL
jgi:HAD-hyrolase-like